MRVRYRSRSARTAETVYEQVGDVRFCCEAMRERWGLLIGFGALGHRRSTDRAVNLYSVVTQANGTSLLGMTPVDFCPFCGEPIETCRVK